MQSTWPHSHPPVACKRRCFQMWTTASLWGPTRCVRAAQLVVVGGTWCTTRLYSVLKSSLHSTTAQATAQRRRLKHPALPSRQWWTSATMKAGCSPQDPRPSRKSMDIVDYSVILTCGLLRMSSRHVGLREPGRSSTTDTFQFKSQTYRWLKAPVLRQPTRLVVWIALV